MTASPLAPGSASEAPAPTAFHVLAKPIGPICNLECKYCFYLEKEAMYKQAAPKGPPAWQMRDDVLESYVRQYIEQQDAPEVRFAWQGGEPALLGVRFFKRVVALQQRYANGKRIMNALQTNGTLLDDDWGAFLAENGFLVGLSLDGPRELHDAYRQDKHGRPTFDAVMRGLEKLKRHHVEYNTLTVVNRLNSREPERVYRFLKEVGSGFMQFIPLVERVAPGASADPRGPFTLALAPPGKGSARAPVTDWSVRPKEWGVFLTTIFDHWVRNDVGRVFVQQFDVALGAWSGAGAAVCVFAQTCGKALVIEHNGDIYPCDHYVYPEFLLGNSAETSLVAAVNSPAQVAFGNDKRDSLPGCCRQCDVLFACNGECPKHRFLRTPKGEPGLNYLCEGYQRFFRHVDPYMRTMTTLLRSRRAPADIMDLLARTERERALKTAGRNDPCPCGSGRKYKQCCLQGG